MSLISSIVAYWKLDEGSGTRSDSHGANHLTDNNTVAAVAGKVGNAASFLTANAEWLSCAANPDLALGDLDWTICGWMRSTDVTANRGVLAKYSGASATSAFVLYTIGGTLNFGLCTGVGATYLTGPTISNNVWAFFVFWFDSVANTMNLQVNNGTPVSNVFPAVPNVGTDPLEIGRHTSGTYAFTGQIDEVGFWKRVLTAQERTDLYAAGAGLSYPFVAPASGTLSATLGAMTCSASATAAARGTASVALGTCALVATGTADVRATLAASLAPVTLAAIGSGLDSIWQPVARPGASAYRVSMTESRNATVLSEVFL